MIRILMGKFATSFCAAPPNYNSAVTAERRKRKASATLSLLSPCVIRGKWVPSKHHRLKEGEERVSPQIVVRGLFNPMV